VGQTQNPEDAKSTEQKQKDEAEEAKRQELIEKYSDSYDIKKVTKTALDGSKYTVYEITAKDDVNLFKLKEQLGINNGVISKYNEGYEHYDDNGGHIDNKRMKGVTIKIPVSELGARESGWQIMKTMFKNVGEAAIKFIRNTFGF
jgi:hypothetical protein